MKKLMIALVVAAFACGVAVQAGEGCCKEKSACNAKAKSAKKADGSVRGAQLLVKR